MSRQKDDTGWLQRGRQRTAVAQVLRKPMTATEIWTAVQIFNPRIQLRDLWHLLKQMQERKLVRCRNPRLVTGRIYEWTESGEKAVASACGLIYTPAPAQTDMRKYSWVVRAKIRRLILWALADLESKLSEPQTATAIRKRLRSEYAVGLNPVIRALKDLVKLGLVRPAGLTEERCCKLYRLTPAGRRILEQLKR